MEPLNQSKWIAATSSQPLPIFRRGFRIDKPIRKACVTICGLGQFELRLNDEKIGDDVMEPGWTDYRKTCQYVMHDVTAQLRDGDNECRVLLGNGMYNVIGGRYVKFKGSFGEPKLILAMDIEYSDGTATRIVSDESWQAVPGPITFSCIYGGEDYDARLEEPTEWHAVKITDGPGGELIPQTAPPIRVMQSFKPVAVHRSAPGITIYDLGQNFSGWPRIGIRGAAGDTVKLMTGELLDERGLVTQKNTGSPVSFSYTCRGEGLETWHPQFSFTGFRYVQAEGAALESLEGDFVHAAAKVVGHFGCSNPLLNQIHELILAAIRSNMQNVLTDCPHREKLGWLEQTHLMGSAIFCNFDVADYYAKISRDMREAQSPSGCVPTIAPQYTSFKPPWEIFNDSPEWGSAVVVNPWLIYQRTGDKKILEENYEAMRRYMDYLHSREKNGIVDYGLGDWYDIGPGDPGLCKLTSVALTATATYFADLKIIRQTAILLNRNSDAEHFTTEAERVRIAFNTKFFNTESKQYDRNSQTASAMPLALGMVEPNHRDVVLENLVRDIRKHDNHITAGDIGFHYVIRALAENGRSEVIYDLLTRTDPPSYGSQLARGATSLTEAWDANPKNSQNHLMLGHAELWFHEYLAGIRFDLSQPEPRRIVIHPAIVGDLTWAEASYESPLGLIKSRWEQQGDSVRLQVTIPAGQKAIVHLPVRGNQRDGQVSGGSHEFRFTV